MYEFPGGETMAFTYAAGVMEGGYEERAPDGTLTCRGTMVSDLPCRREGGQSLVIGGPSLVILEGNACNPF